MDFLYKAKAAHNYIITSVSPIKSTDNKIQSLKPIFIHKMLKCGHDTFHVVMHDRST